MEKEKSNSYRWKMLTITCSKSTIGTLEKGVEYAHKVNNKNNRTTSVKSNVLTRVILLTY